MRSEKWLEKKDVYKQKQKEKSKKSKNSYIHLVRFNKISQETPDQPKFTKQEKQKMFKELCEQGPKYIIDCDFEDYMGERELKSLGQQLAYCYAINKK